MSAFPQEYHQLTNIRMVLDNHIHIMLMVVATKKTTLHAIGWSCDHATLGQQAMLATAPC
jgi:hypothetical protein